MFITIYSPGGTSVAGDFRARFETLNDYIPPVIATDSTVSIAGQTIVLHATEFNAETREYIVPFTVPEGMIDGTKISVGLLVLLGMSIQKIRLLSIERDFQLPLEIPILILAVVLIYFILKR